MRAVAIKFDAVPIGIAQIKRFADAVIACAVERNLRHVQAAQRVGQFGACRIQNGEMIKAGCSMRWRTSARALPSVQTDVMMITAGGDKRGIIAVALHQFKSEYATIKIQRTLEICDFEMDMADADARIDRF